MQGAQDRGAGKQLWRPPGSSGTTSCGGWIDTKNEWIDGYE